MHRARQANPYDRTQRFATSMPLADGNRITFERTLRPLRVGYRVDPRSSADLLLAAETATMQWGGRFHALIPVMRRRPSWWRWPAPGGPSAAELATDYERGFDCDFVVDTSTSSRDGLGYREVDLAKLREATQWSAVGAGLCVAGVYDWLWREEFRFEARHRLRPILPLPASTKMELFTKACFGGFTAARPDIEERYRKLFEPEEVVVGPEQLLDLFSLTAVRPPLSPLDIGAWGLRWMPRGFGEPALMLVDPERALDLFDFWNLRASGQEVAAIPLSWLDELAPLLGSRLAGRGGQEQGALRVYVSRGSNLGAIESIRNRLADLGRPFALSHPGDASLRLGSLMAAEVEAERGETEVSVQQGMVEVPLLAPAVSDREHAGVNAWMNTLEIRPWTVPRDGSVAPFVPSALGQVRDLLGGWSGMDVRAGPFGLEASCSRRRDTLSMRPPSGRVVMEKLLQLEGFTPIASDAGTVAERLIVQLGSLSEVALLRHVGLLRLMNRAATSGVAVDVGEEERPLRARVDFIRRRALMAELSRGFGQDRAARILKMLVDRNVLRVGLSLSCEACHFVNWVELDEIQPTLRCRRCLENYSFPQAMPPDDASWAYRPTGACSVEYFARGAYTVAHALRVLEQPSDAMVWCTGTALGPTTEIDFAACRKRTRDGGKPILLIGEAKSLNEFGPKDFACAHRLLSRLSDSVFVFATLRDRLTSREKAAIKRLVRPNATSWLQVPMTPRVMVLTSRELLHVGGMPDCWREGPTYVADLYEENERYVRDETVMWADLTLRLHAGLGPHDEWSMRRRTQLVKAAKPARATSVRRTQSRATRSRTPRRRPR